MSLKITTNLVEASRISSFDPDNIAFGRIFTDHMFSCEYKNGSWQNFRIAPFGKIQVSPTLSALHYGQSIFEGMKAFRNPDGVITLFRPHDNLARLNRSADRMCMPELPEEVFMEALNRLVMLEQAWIPVRQGSALYIRPFMFGTDDYLGVRPSEQYMFMIYACPVGAYYSNPLKIKIEEKYTRAAEGGVGSAKCAGNYAASMYPTRLAQKEGFDQVLWTDGATHSYLEETGTSNVFVIADGVAYTPELNDTLLAGITRDSVIQLLRHRGMQVEERKISVDELINWHKKGVLNEMFVTGTAATITGIELFSFRGETFRIAQETAVLGKDIKSTLYDIRTLAAPDPFGWVTVVGEGEIITQD